jgi:molecular chaperone GrpE
MTRKDDILEDEDRDEKDARAEVEEKGLEAVELPRPSAQEYEKVKRERDELKDQVLRRRADFDNYRKRVERDRDQAALEAKAQVLAGLLPTVDNLEKALEAPVESERVLRDGVQLVYRNLLAYLESQGVVIRDPIGETFDPQVHQALLYEAVPGFADGTIVEVFRKAYFLKDRLLRAALVKVAKQDDKESETRH